MDFSKQWLGSLIVKNEFNKYRDTNDFIFDNLPRKDYLTLLKTLNVLLETQALEYLKVQPCLVLILVIGKTED